MPPACNIFYFYYVFDVVHTLLRTIIGVSSIQIDETWIFCYTYVYSSFDLAGNDISHCNENFYVIAVAFSSRSGS
jgi:hypothetical protein